MQVYHLAFSSAHVDFIDLDLRDSRESREETVSC